MHRTLPVTGFPNPCYLIGKRQHYTAIKGVQLAGGGSCKQELYSYRAEAEGRVRLQKKQAAQCKAPGH